MSKPKVFVTRPLPSGALEELAARTELIVRGQDAPLTAEEFAAGCRDAEGLLLVGHRITAESLEHAPRLRAVSTPSVGYDNVDLAACTARGIAVANLAGVLEDTTADLAFALLLAVARRIVEGDRYVREGRWQAWQFGLLHGEDIHGRTLGLYGFGRIGQAVARRARGFSMRILYYQRRRVSPAIERALEAQFVDRQRLISESDFLSLHVPLTPETHHAIGSSELAMMKPTAFLINTARGKVVDEEALVQALTRRTIAGAGLDVFEHEPHVHPALLTLPNVVLMPHVGSATGATRFEMARHAARNLLDLLEGRRPATLLNPEALAARKVAK